MSKMFTLEHLAQGDKGMSFRQGGYCLFHVSQECGMLIALAVPREFPMSPVSALHASGVMMTIWILC